MTAQSGDSGDEFADFVRARQHQLRQAAFLLHGDVERADLALTRALSELARRWKSLGDESPDVVVRRYLYREVPAGQRERAVAVLRVFEERSEAEAIAVLGRSAVVGQGRPPSVSRDELLDAVHDVGEKDFVALARGEARSRGRRVRRRLLAGAAVVAVVVGAMGWRSRDDATQDALPAPTPSPSLSTPRSASETGAVSKWDRRSTDVLGVEAQIGPTAAQVARLPLVDDLRRSQLALPDSLGLPSENGLPTLSSIGANSAPVRAVLLRWNATGWNPVLYRPTLTQAPYQIVDDVTLQATVDERGQEFDPLEVQAIADDRRHLLFVQSSKVFILDAFSGKVSTIAVADPYLSGGGFAPDGVSAIVWSNDNYWRVTAEPAAARRVTTSYADAHRVSVEPPDGMRVHGFRDDGSTASTATGPRVLGGVLGETMSNDGGGYATAGWLSQASLDHLQRGDEADVPPCAAFAAGGQIQGFGRLLIAPPGELVPCAVLGWAFADDAFVRWGDHLLVWDTRTGDLSRVGVLPPTAGDPGSGPASGLVALAP